MAKQSTTYLLEKYYHVGWKINCLRENEQILLFITDINYAAQMLQVCTFSSDQKPLQTVFCDLHKRTAPEFSLPKVPMLPVEKQKPYNSIFSISFHSNFLSNFLIWKIISFS